MFKLKVTAIEVLHTDKASNFAVSFVWNVWVGGQASKCSTSYFPNKLIWFDFIPNHSI